MNIYYIKMEVSEKMNDANETNKIESELNKKFESPNTKEINEKYI